MKFNIKEWNLLKFAVEKALEMSKKERDDCKPGSSLWGVFDRQSDDFKALLDRIENERL